MNTIRLTDLFNDQEMESLKEYEEIFSTFLVELEKIALIAERFPFSFRIGEKKFCFNNRNEVENAKKMLNDEYDEAAFLKMKK
ncbi:MAG TPA: hypothetical protein VKY57_04090 [Chitinispirillaceae bacterium]|nr:hypothetical protein [Fibrobacter sp.]HLV30733.1 hypothetical protein [Chitinispirillaceae bacterium]